MDDFEPKFTKEAIELLLKYGFYCCIPRKYKDFRWDNIKRYNDIENSLEGLLPNAYNSIICMAQDYGLEKITQEVVHAYFFTYHNKMHEKEGDLEHQAYVGIVKEVYNGNKEVLIKRIEKNGNKEVLVLNPYNYLLKKGAQVIIHAGCVVTTEVPEELRRLSGEKDIRAWESYVRGR